jgi:hypothetical protein
MEKSQYFGQAQQLLKDSLKQAYLETPWRKQVQLAATFLAVLIGAAILAWIYLSVSSEAVAAGLDIQDIRRLNRHLRYVNAEMESKIADLSSATVMRMRIKDMNFQPVDLAQVIYLSVPGYHEDAAYLGAASDEPAMILPTRSEGPLITPEYTQSWIDWLYQQMKDLKPLYQLSGEIGS